MLDMTTRNPDLGGFICDILGSWNSGLFSILAQTAAFATCIHPKCGSKVFGALSTLRQTATKRLKDEW
jgi:hypothetical protein